MKIEGENNTLREILKIKFGLISRITFKEPKKFLKPYIRFTSESSVKLLKITEQFATPDLMYKVDEKQYLIHKNTTIDKEAIIKEFLKKHNTERKEYGQDLYASEQARKFISETRKNKRIDNFKKRMGILNV